MPITGCGSHIVAHTSLHPFLPNLSVSLSRSDDSASCLLPLLRHHRRLSAVEMAEVCSQQQPSRKDNNISNKTFQAWKTLLYWVAFFFQVVLQILRGTLSGAKVLSCFGFGHHLLFSSDSVSGADVDLSPSTAFKLLPSEIPEAEVDVDVNKEEEGLTVMPVCPPLPLVCADGVLEKLTVVLDLDETLVCAYETSTLPAIIRSQAIEAGLKCFELECISAEREVDGKQKVNHVTVFERPHLQEFLQKLNGFADLILFTAGLEGYARPLVDKIDVEKRFRLRLYRPATVTTEYREHVKDLSCLSTNFCRTVIVDNNPFSFLLQPLNGIPCIPFYAGQPYDDQLIGVLLPLLRRLSFEMDVRPVLCEIFHMPGWFQKHGIPMSKWIPN